MRSLFFSEIREFQCTTLDAVRIPSHTHGFCDSAMFAEAILLLMDQVAFSYGTEDKLGFSRSQIAGAFPAHTHIGCLLGALSSEFRFPFRFSQHSKFLFKGGCFKPLLISHFTHQESLDWVQEYIFQLCV